jgi:hypothetical protein
MQVCAQRMAISWELVRLAAKGINGWWFAPK